MIKSFWNDNKMTILRFIFLFHFGGATYASIEVFWRNHSHPTMYVLGAICFLTLHRINDFFPWRMPMWIQMIIGSLWITILELIFGIVFNTWLGWGIWDYSDMAFNFMGQITLLFSFFWFWLAAVGILLFDWINHWFFDGERPHYYWTFKQKRRGN